MQRPQKRQRLRLLQKVQQRNKFPALLQIKKPAGYASGLFLCSEEPLIVAGVGVVFVGDYGGGHGVAVTADHFTLDDFDFWLVLRITQSLDSADIFAE
jgi:hypothetical protein